MSGSALQPHHTVEQLKITGGFLDGVQFELVDGLNCFIGGRGAGKTTALEMLRFVLDLMPNARDAPQRHRHLDALIKANLRSGRVTAMLRTTQGIGYTANRAYAQDVQVRSETGETIAISLSRDLIFGAEVFSQNEIEEIASSPAAQLALLDRFIQSEATTTQNEMDNLLRQLRQTSTDLIRIDGEIEQLRASASVTTALQEKLKGLELLDGAETTNVPNHRLKHQRQKESAVVEHLLGSARAASESLESDAAAFGGILAAEFDEATIGGENAEAIKPIENEARAFRRVLETAAATVATARVVLESNMAIAAVALAQRHAEQNVEYLRLLGELKERGGKIAERDLLQTQLTAALGAQKQLISKEAERRAVAEKRQRFLVSMSESRDRRFQARKRVADELTREFGGGIRITVQQDGDSDAFEAALTEMLRGSGIQQGPAAEKIAQHMVPTELAHAVSNDDLAAFEEAGLDEKKARRVIAALLAEGRVYEIELAELGDRPRVELRDGTIYKDSTQLSTGQRCTTILPVVLLQSERPLLVDQPEDNLDNAFIYETVVKSLRSAKGRRQIIFVTHNPNIPVLGEADRVFVLESDGQRARVKSVGTVDECRTDIEAILEGGPDAFLKRKVRYGY